ncbi:hypothetical protein BJV77DRAFT_1030840 [Russula vinacea]|nr:hypothetical protein BJV77DRAFT_1030840 [Russula vinacea]
MLCTTLDRVYCQQCKRHSAHGKKIASKHAHEQLKVSVTDNGGPRIGTVKHGHSYLWVAQKFTKISILIDICPIEPP